MPAVMMVINSLSVCIGKQRPNGKRRFSLAHEDGCRDVQRFRAAHAHQAVHDPGHALDDDLHHAKVIQQRKKSGDKNNGRQHLKSEDETKLRRTWIEKRQMRVGIGGVTEISKNKS